jgi:hypothetical protein
MPTREELHQLVDTLPEGAMRAAHQALSHFQTWPPPPPPDLQEMRKRMEERRLEMRQGQKPGTTGGFGGTSGYDPTKGAGSSSFQYWDGDTFVQETLRNHKRHELKVVERIRIEGPSLIYQHAVTGPGGKLNEREVTFDIPQD